jgi:hypothetical protein
VQERGSVQYLKADDLAFAPGEYDERLYAIWGSTGTLSEPGIRVSHPTLV